MNKSLENSLWSLAFLLVGLAYLFGLFIDLTGDSGLYAAISRQMVESGDWFNLKINGQPYDQKPHLFFWLAGLGIKFFGNTNFAFKLFPFIFGISGIYFTFRLGKQIYNSETGKWGAIIAGTSQIYFLYFFDFHTDTVLQAGVVLALWQLAAYMQNQKLVHFIFGFFGIGLAMLSKGPIGAVLPFFAVLLFLLAKNDFRQLFHLKWILGVFIVMMVISPTLIHLYKSFGFQGLEFYFITNNFGRITGEYAGSSNDYLFYFHTILWAFLPWTILLVPLLFFEIRSWFQQKRKIERGVYLLGGVMFLSIVLSIAKGKAPNYFFIAISPISILVGSWLVDGSPLPEKVRKNLIKAQMFFLGFILAFFVFVVVVFAENDIIFPLILLLISVGVFLLYFNIRDKELLTVIIVSVIITGALNLFVNAKVYPILFEYQGARQVLTIYENNKNEQTQLYNFEVEEYELFFYAKNSIVHLQNWEELRIAMNKPGTWLYTNEIKYNDIIEMNFQIDTIYEIRHRGMNRVDIQFLNPATREKSLKTNYLIVTAPKKEK